jgi:hypothetical protein
VQATVQLCTPVAFARTSWSPARRAARPFRALVEPQQMGVPQLQVLPQAESTAGPDKLAWAGSGKSTLAAWAVCLTSACRSPLASVRRSSTWL